MLIDIEQIGGKYQIEFEGNEYILSELAPQKTGKNAGVEKKKVLGYYTKLDTALNALIKKELGSREDRVTLKRFIDEYKKLQKELLTTINI